MDIRKQFPHYEDLSDRQLADAVHQKFYSDIPQHEFYNKIRLMADVDTGELRLGQTTSKPADDRGYLGRASDAFSEAVGPRLGLDPQNYSAVNKYANFLTPVVDAAAMVGNVADGAIRAGTSVVSDALYDVGMAPKGASRDKARRGLDEVVDVMSAGVAGTPGMAFKPTVRAPKPVLRPIAEKARRGVKSLAGTQSIDEIANNQLRKALDADMMDGAELRRRLDAWDGTDNPAILDLLGENGLARVRDTASNIGPGRKVLDDYSQGVLAGQETRAREIFARNLSDKGDYLKELDTLAEHRQRSARPLYEAAHADAVQPSGSIKLIVGTQNGQQAIRRAIRIANAEGVQLEGVFKQGNRFVLGAPVQLNKMTGARTAPSAVPVRTLDYIKQGFDDLVERYRDKTTGKLVLDKQGSATNKQLRRLIGEIDELSPAYRHAREAWAGPSATIDAMDRGRKYFSSDKSPADIIRVLRDPNMTASEKEFFRAGAVQALLRNIQKRVDNGNKFNAVSRSTDSRAKLVALFEGDEARADAFMKQFMAENDRVQRALAISPKTGSQTNPRNKAGLQLGASDLLDLQSPSMWARLGGKAVNAVRSKKQLQQQQAADEFFARLVTSPIRHPSDLAGLLDMR